MSEVSKPAGELYDSIEGKQRFAWVDGDEIRSVGYFQAKPEDEGRTWLPVRHVDSEPFNIAKHWREKPVITIAGDHVRCEYPVAARECA